MDTKHFASATVILTLLASLGTARAQTRSPPPGLALRAVAESATSGARLAITRDGVERGFTAMPLGLSQGDIDDGLRRALWHPNGRDVALGFKGAKESFVVVFLQQADGR